MGLAAAGGPAVAATESTAQRERRGGNQRKSDAAELRKRTWAAFDSINVPVPPAVRRTTALPRSTAIRVTRDRELLPQRHARRRAPCTMEVDARKLAAGARLGGDSHGR